MCRGRTATRTFTIATDGKYLMVADGQIKKAVVLVFVCFFLLQLAEHMF